MCIRDSAQADHGDVAARERGERTASVEAIDPGEPVAPGRVEAVVGRRCGQVVAGVFAHRAIVAGRHRATPVVVCFRQPSRSRSMSTSPDQSKPKSSAFSRYFFVFLIGLALSLIHI